MQMAVGNVVGSNIVNIGLVLGLSSLITPLVVHRYCITRDFPILTMVMIIAFALIADNFLSVVNGVLLVMTLIYYVGYMIFTAKQKLSTLDAQELSNTRQSIILYRVFIWWCVGLFLLFVSSELLVTGASNLARHFGVSELVIGLTVVALGTSLPELATTLVAAMKHQHDIAVGNVIGSNIFNLLAVLAVPALIAPGVLDKVLVLRDYPVMVGFALACWFFAWFARKSKYQLGRISGAILLSGCVLYYYFLL
jgi:cation:H+ antiporter